jgi:hypothetical protein
VRSRLRRNERSLAKPPLGPPTDALSAALRRFTWSAVFERIESVWREVMRAG